MCSKMFSVVFPSFWLFQHGCSSMGWTNSVFIQCLATVEINELDLYSCSSFINIVKSVWSGEKANFRICVTWCCLLKLKKYHILVKDTYTCSESIKKFMRIINTKFRVMVTAGREGGDTGTSTLWAKFLKLGKGGTQVYVLYTFMYILNIS